MTDSLEMPIFEEGHILAVRGAVRQLVTDHLQFSSLERMQVVTAVSELTRNIFNYAGKGKVTASIVQRLDGRRGVRIVFKDEGPGIPDIEQAMRPKSILDFDKGMGVGMSGSKKLADEFEIHTQVGKGTVIIWIKWEHRAK